MNKPRIIAIIQARRGSTRLADKVLLPLEGKTVLGHVIDRVARAKNIDEAIVATTTSKDDAKIAGLCSKNGVAVYRGSENDVLDRYYQAAKLHGAGHVVRITADCPLIDHKIIDEAINLHLGEHSDYTFNNAVDPTFPDGEDVEVFTFASLEKAWKKAALHSEREHVTSYIWQNPGIFKLARLAYKEDLSAKRWTLDEERDYVFIKTIYENLYYRDKYFGMEEILKYLKKHPECEEINRDIKRNEGYERSIREDGKIARAVQKS